MRVAERLLYRTQSQTDPLWMLDFRGDQPTGPEPASHELGDDESIVGDGYASPNDPRIFYRVTAQGSQAQQMWSRIPGDPSSAAMIHTLADGEFPNFYVPGVVWPDAG